MGKILFKQSNGLISVIWTEGSVFTILHEHLSMRKLCWKWVQCLLTVDQKTNWLSAEWTAAGESHPKRPKIQTSAGKVLASVFWDAQAILFIDYLEKGRAINSEYYIALLVRLKEEIAKKRPQMKKKRSSLTKAMHRVIWQNYMNCTLNYFCTHPILHIWPPVTTGCL